MSKLIDPNTYLKILNYHKKYGICKKKLYRHLDDENVDTLIIDGVPFIKDKEFPALQKTYNVKKLTSVKKNVKIGTFKKKNVKIETFEFDEDIDNQEDMNVKNETFDMNVKIETFDDVKFETLSEEQKLSLQKPQKEYLIADWELFKKIKKE